MKQEDRFPWHQMQTLKPSVTMRRAGRGDADLVRDLTRAAYAKWVPVIGREPMPMQADYVKAVDTHQIDLLCDDGEVKALIEIIPHEDHLFIENVAVAPEHQGRGYGRFLLANAEDLARAFGLPEMRLLTNRCFASDVQLYLRAVYRIIREEPFTEGVTVHMSKPLPLR